MRRLGTYAKSAGWAACGLALALGGCGQRAELKPAKGGQLPPAPYGDSQRPTAAQLLRTPTIAVPQRSVELRTRSEPREDDPFDLPPPEKLDVAKVPRDGVAPVPSTTPTPTSTPDTSGN